MSITVATPVARGLIFVAVAAVAWGSGGIVAALLYRETGMGPVATSFWRTLIGAALLALAYRLRRSASSGSGPRERGDRVRRWAIHLTTGIGLAVYQTAYYAAVVYAGAAVATVLTLGTAPILIALGSRFAIGERLSRAGVAAVLVAPVGLALVVGGTVGGTVAGVLAALLSAVGYTTVTVLHRALGGVDPAGTTMAGFAVASACLAPLALWEGLWPTGAVDWRTFAELGYLGVFCTAVAYSLFFASLGAVRATTAGMVTLIEPVTATGLAVVLLGEQLSWPMVAGSLVLLAAVLLLARSEVAEPLQST
jgi:drug/metabolite transporter, DME family